MKKRWWFAFFSLFCFVSCVSAGVMSEIQNRFDNCMSSGSIIQDLNNWSSPGKYAECKGEGYRVLLEKSGTISQLRDKPHRWIPSRGSVAVSENAIVVHFKPDDDMINFFKTKFISSNARMPMGLEVDISPLNNDVFYGCTSIVGFNTKELGLFLDTSADDSHPSCGAVIRNPHKMEAGKTYTVIFFAVGGSWDKPSQLIRANGEVRFGFQVSLDTRLAGLMASSYDAGDRRLDGYTGDGQGGGFDYFVLNSDGFSAINVAEQRLLCWTNKSSDDRGCTAGFPFRNPPVESVIANGGKVPPSYFTSGVASAYSGTASVPKKGQGGASQVTDSPQSGKPNFVGKSIRLYDTSGVERYTFKKTEEIKMRGRLSNDGSANIPSDKKVKSMFLLSKGYKEDPHGDWQKNER